MPTKLPRINVTITEEQRALLFELAELEGGSAAGFIRQLLDKVTPLLRASIPLFRAAAQEHQITVEEGRKRLEEALREMSHTGILDQLDFDSIMDSRRAATVRNAASGASEAERRGPTRGHGAG